jgi:hypothetical protein
MSRKRIGLQLEKSTTAGSIVKTSAINEQEYLAPGSNGQLLTVVGGVPTWQTFTVPADYQTYANIAALPVTGSSSLIYYATAENQFLIWNGTIYVPVPASPTIIAAGNSGSSQTIASGATLSLLASLGFTTVASATGIITVTPPSGTVTGQVMTWNNTTSTWSATTLSSATFTAAGDLGTSQTITAGDTLTIKGATNSGIKVTGVATDVLEISTTRVREKFTPTTAGTTVTLASTPITASLEVYRNGDLQDITDDYTISGAVITFLTAFGSSNGGTLSEIVNVIYYTA